MHKSKKRWLHKYQKCSTLPTPTQVASRRWILNVEASIELAPRGALQTPPSPKRQGSRPKPESAYASSASRGSLRAAAGGRTLGSGGDRGELGAGGAARRVAARQDFRAEAPAESRRVRARWAAPALPGHRPAARSLQPAHPASGRGRRLPSPPPSAPRRRHAPPASSRGR